MTPKYPKEILPHSNYKRRMDVDELLKKYYKLLVVRTVEGCPEDFYMQTENGDKELSDKVFMNNMANLSMNLAGGLFITDSKAHLRFLPTNKEASEIWESGDIPAELYNSEECYRFFENCFGLCFFASSIHNRTFPFYKHFNSQEERDKYEEDTIKAKTKFENSSDAKFVGAFDNKKKPVLVKPLIKIHHMPTKVNYWHMTLDTFRPTDTECLAPTEKQSSPDKKMFKALKQDLLQCCQINLTPEYSIDSCDYTVDYQKDKLKD